MKALPINRDPRGRLGALGSRPMMRGVRIGGRILVAMLSVFVLVGGGYAWATYRNFVSNLTTVDLGTGPKVHGAMKKDIDGKDQNILIVGDDSREGATPAELAEMGTQQNAGENTDTIMLLHVPANGKQASVISFPRDSWVNIPGYGMNKINAAFALGKQNGGDSAGAQLLSQVIYNMTGLAVDHFAKVSLLAFLRISKAIGGVPVCLLAAQNSSTDSDAFGSGYSGINLKKGWNTIEGKQALAFVRQRHGVDGGDFGRVVRQQYFLSAAFRKIQSSQVLLNPIKLQDLLNAVSKSLEVDKGLAGTGMFNLATQMKSLTAGNLKFAQIPITGTPMIDGISVDQVDDAAMPDFIAKMIGQPTSYQKAKAAPVTSVAVTVLNGSEIDGRAKTNADALTAFGFKIAGTPSNADKSTATRIEYAPGMESQAKALKPYVPGAVLSITKSVKSLTLVLGTDGKQVKGLNTVETTTPSNPAIGGASAARSAAQKGCIS